MLLVMGNIKDAVDLIDNLANRREYGKFSGEIQKIQRMILDVQKELADLTEKNIALMKENNRLGKETSPGTPPHHSDENQDLPDECNDMLVYIAKHAGDALKRTPDSIFAASRLSLSKGDYFLNQLIHRKYIKPTSFNTDGMGIMGNNISCYKTEQGGLQYLAERGLLK